MANRNGTPSATGLSAAGYVTVCGVLGLENLLDGTEGLPGTRDRERLRDPGLYYLRVFGEPGGAEPWGWRFGGHHVSLNNLVVNGEPEQHRWRVHFSIGQAF